MHLYRTDLHASEIPLTVSYFGIYLNIWKLFGTAYAGSWTSRYLYLVKEIRKHGIRYNPLKMSLK